MKRTKIAVSIMMAAAFGVASPARAADVPPAAVAQPAGAPTLGPAPPAPGVFLAKKVGPKLHLVVTGQIFTSRDDIEKYLAYRAAEQTMDGKFSWFTFVEHRAKGNKVPMPKGDPLGPRYSFRFEFFRPTWRYKVAGSPAWKGWSPFSGDAFFADGVDPKTITDYEVTADVVMHKGMADDINPLAFDASATSDYLINQVQPPK